MDLSTNNLPQHVAIIMDGNGRWAQRRMLPRVAGHRSGVSALREVVGVAANKSIKALTVFAFGRENWRRPEDEVKFLMQLFLKNLSIEAKKLHKNNVRVRIIGERAVFSPELQKTIQDAEELTAQNTGLFFNIAVNYSGRWDIVEATRKIAQQVSLAQLSPAAITPELFSSYLELADLPEPDLLIRTSGELRISNFLLWQLAYTEFYFTDVLWPDFSAKHFTDALEFFAKRQRRFGHTGEQLRQKTDA